MKCKIKNYKTPGRKYRGQTSGHWNGQEFSKQDHKIRGNKAKRDKKGYVELKSFYPWREILIRLKGQTTERGENIFKLYNWQVVYIQDVQVSVKHQ